MTTSYLVLQASGRHYFDFDGLRYCFSLTKQRVELLIVITVMNVEFGRLLLFGKENQRTIRLDDHISLELNLLYQFPQSQTEIAF